MDTFNVVDNESRIGQSVGSFLKRRRIPPQELVTESFDEATVDKYMHKMLAFKDLTPNQLLTKTSIIYSILSPLKSSFQKLSTLYLSLETKTKEFVKDEYGLTPAAFMTVTKKIESDMIKYKTLGQLEKVSKMYSLVFTLSTLQQLRNRDIEVTPIKLYSAGKEKVVGIAKSVKRRMTIDSKNTHKKGGLSMETKLLLITNMVAMLEALNVLIPETKKFKGRKTLVLKVLLVLTMLGIMYACVGAIKEARTGQKEE